MNVGQLDHGERMADDAYAYFMAAWKHKMKQSGYSQKLIAERTNNSPQWINACLKERNIKKGKVAKASVELQGEICEVFEYSYVDFLQLGRRVLENVPGSRLEQGSTSNPTPPKIPHTISRVDSTEVLSAVSTLVGQYQESERLLRFWREIFETLPVCAMILKDGIVEYQNNKSRKLGKLIGGPLCEKCASGCEHDQDCPIGRATVTLQSVGYQVIAGSRYKVDVSVTRWQEHEHIVILATEASNDDTMDRRGGNDRREELQGE